MIKFYIVFIAPPAKKDIFSVYHSGKIDKPYSKIPIFKITSDFFQLSHKVFYI